MDLQSYIQLKEAYANVHAPREEVFTEVTTEEVDSFIDALLEEGYDLSEFTWEEVRDAYLEEGIANDPKWGVIGQAARLGQKMFGNASQRNSANSYEKSVNDINKRRKQNPGTSTATANEIAAETRGRRLADPKYKPGQGVDSGQKLTANKPATAKAQPQASSGGGSNTGGGGGSSSSSSSRPVQKAAPARDRMANASKADRMGAWAKANPTLAKNNAARASTRGTTASSNPMMKGMGTAPKTTKPATTPKPSTSSAGASSIGSAATSTPKPSTTPKPKATPIKSSRLSKALSSVGESVDPIWEEVEAFAQSLVEEEGIDLSEFTWDEVREVYLDEQGGSNRMRSILQKNRQTVKATKPAPAPAASSSFTSRRNARRSASPAARANTNSSGQNIKTTPAAAPAKAEPAKVQPKAEPAKVQPKAEPAKVQPKSQSSRPQPQSSRPQPKAAPAKAEPTKSPTSTKDSSASAGASAIGSATAKARPTATAIKSNRLRDALDSARKPAPMKEETDFDVILEYLVDSGFPQQEALAIMVEMSEEKREEILENRRAARAAGGYKDDSKKQTDPSKDGFTGISGSIKDIMRQSAEMDKKKKKSVKEDRESLAAAYRAVYSEEASDTKKDKHLENGGHSAKTDYSKPPSTGNTFGKKAPMSEKDRSEALAKFVSKMKDKK